MTRLAGWVVCPVHDARVPVDAEGRLLAQCDGCAGEAARASRFIREHDEQALGVGRAREWAASTVARYGNSKGRGGSAVGASAAAAEEVTL